MSGTHKRTNSVEKAGQSPFAVPYTRSRAGSTTSRDRLRAATKPLTEMDEGFINSPSPLKRSDALPNLLNPDQAISNSPSVLRSRRFPNVRKQASVDNFTVPGHRDSPFGTPQAMANSSIHPINPSYKQSRPPHPLSRGSTISTTTSGNAKLPQDKSALRPSTIDKFKIELTQSENNFSTPDALKAVKPLATAFMSTGLLSKRNRPLDHLKVGKPTPDTPCKRPSTMGMPQTPGTPGTPLGTKEFFNNDKNPIDDNSLDEYLFLDHDGDSSFIYASSSSEFDGTPHTPTRSLFSLSNGSTADRKRRKPLLFGRSPADDDNYFMNSMTDIPLDASRLSISSQGTPGAASADSMRAGTTPSQTTILTGDRLDISTSLDARFKNVEKIGTGEFSEVYVVQERTSQDRFAVKCSKTASSTAKDRHRRQEEVLVLQQIGKHEHIIELQDSWEASGHLFIQTEFCENGSLDVFLQDLGRTQRLDEFRVWKVLTELALGVSYIHDQGFLHLDLKPANIFITFEGVLKIGDFGMSVQYPAPEHIEREGDREYIAPEVLASGHYDKPVDIFSLGLIILEVAANIVLPDNGASWQKLRSGDLSDAPRLSSSDEGTMPQSVHEQVVPHRYIGRGGLDRVVKSMLAPDPAARPVAWDILNIEEVQWVNRVRRAGAVIFEGERGPTAQNDYDMYMVDEETNMEDDGQDWRMEM